MTRPTPLSGFPEWLPAQRIVELDLLDKIRRTFELHGFASVDTRSVEPLDQLLRKGETSKEVYVLRRLQADAADSTDSGLGLHFDLTVPFARYVLENSGKLQFPFRRYQIQKCWRGERPQEGRYREFIQADIDVIDRDSLGGHYEAELPIVVAEALADLPFEFRMHVNNRKISEGFYRGVGVGDPEAALRAVDKLDKIGPVGVAKLLVETAGATEEQAARCLKLAEIATTDSSFADQVRALGIINPLLEEGLAELTAVVDAAAEHAPGLLVADMRIARGLDYYTGTVYETFIVGREKLGSVCSGGRYDNLASVGTETFPGVGLSIGVSRILGALFGAGQLSASRSTPTCVLIALPAEEERAACVRIAAALRARGIPVEVAPTAAKFGKQIKFAEKRGIPYVWFPGAEHQVKDIRSGEQVVGDPATWAPAAEDLYPSVRNK